MNTLDTMHLGLHIAYDSARTDIETSVRQVRQKAGEPAIAKPGELVEQCVYDLSAPIIGSFQRDSVAMAVAWMDRVKLLRRNPSQPHLISIGEEPALWVEAAKSIVGKRVAETA